MENIKRQCLDDTVDKNSDEDANLVLDDYESDEEKTVDEIDKDDEEEECHVTKVSIFSFFFIACAEGGVGKRRLTPLLGIEFATFGTLVHLSNCSAKSKIK
jgi:hypothetical protein